MKTLWEGREPRGQCGKAAERGLAIGLALGALLLVAVLAGLL
jgi:hypothetical protein